MKWICKVEISKVLKMRVKKTNVVVALGLGATALFMIYLVIDTINLQRLESELDKVRMCNQSIQQFSNL